MTTAPQWSAIDDDYTLDNVATTDPADHYSTFISTLLMVASSNDGLHISPNVLRREIRKTDIQPQQVGAFTRRALLEGVVVYSGKWVLSDDLKSRNAGRPCRELRITS